MGPFTYEYAIPNDYLQAIYVPWRQTPWNSGAPPGNIVPQNSQLPLESGLNQNTHGYIRPARFLIARDVNFPPAPGQEYDAVQGVSPMGQTVILTDVPHAQLVYTSLVLAPSEFDAIFREAFVAYLASEIAIPLLKKDRKFAIAIKAEQVAIAKDRISEARAQSANEQTNIVSSLPDWIRTRNVGQGFGGGWDGGYGGYGLEGGCWGGWSGVSLGGAVF